MSGFGNISPFFVNVGPASATTGGYLTAGAQSIVGTKTMVDQLIVAEATVTGLGNSQILAAAAGNAALFGVNAGNRSSWGAYSTGGQPFYGFYAYHGTTANTLARSSGTIPPSAILGSSSGGILFYAAAAGAINSDITWTQIAAVTSTGWTMNQPLTVGTSGTAVSQVKVYAPSLTPASVAAATTAEQTFTVTGLATTDKVIVNGPVPTAGTGIVNARVSAADTLALTFVNATAGALTPVAGTYNIVAIRS